MDHELRMNPSHRILHPTLSRVAVLPLGVQAR